MTDKATTEQSQAVPAVGAQVDRVVGRPEPERSEWKHLLRYGYAPGNYMNKCHRCGVVVIVDKRAITCRPCAEAMDVERT